MILNSRQERERERRRQQIIAASKRVFSFKGFSRATVKDIAEEAELSPGTIYIYFKNKDELYAALSIRMLKHLKVRLQRVKAMGALNPDQRIEAVKQALCDVYKVDPPMFITLSHLQASETLENISESLLDQIIDLTQDSLHTLADIFAQGIQNGSFSDIEPSKLALILWSMFSGMIVWEESKRSLDPRKDFLKPTLETAFEIFGRGIRKAEMK
jgi:AcrR family transcriptional regulator